MVFFSESKVNIFFRFTAQQKFVSRQVVATLFFFYKRNKVLTEYFFLPISETEICPPPPQVKWMFP